MEYNKQYTIGDHTFNVCVELNARAERRIGGVVQHKVTINDMGPNNFYKSVYCEKDVIITVSELVREAEDYVNGKGVEGLSDGELALKKLGFE